jgi:hypothetical protein
MIKISDPEIHVTHTVHFVRSLQQTQKSPLQKLTTLCISGKSLLLILRIS